MKRRHFFFLSQISQTQILRSGLAFAVLCGAGLSGASAARAQGDAAGVSPIAVVGTADDSGLNAYVAALPSAPTPKVEAAASALVQTRSQTPISAERGHAFYWLDRKSLTYGLVQGGAEIFDGVTTRYFIHHCSHCFENDPVSRLLLGTHPSWGKMIPMGIAEAAVATYSYRSLSHSPNRILRAAAPFVPVGLTAVHVIEGARNISLKNKCRCADPGYVVMGAVCVPGTAAVLSNVPGPEGSGLGASRDPR
jgi:hypothetical protein